MKVKCSCSSHDALPLGECPGKGFRAPVAVCQLVCHTNLEYALAGDNWMVCLYPPHIGCVRAQNCTVVLFGDYI